MTITAIRSSSKSRDILLVVGSALVAFLAMLALLYVADPTGRAPRQDPVPARLPPVGPLDAEKTLSLFQTFVDGGLQKVTARDASDPRQIALIQAHLREQAKRFGNGDFSDAAKLHSEEMAWLADLEAGAGEIEVHYTDLPDGAQIRYLTTDPKLVSALHRWLMAQLSDREREISSR